MKEELQGKLVEILTSIQTATGKASDFAMEQLPDIAQSYIVYGRASSVVSVVIGVLLFVAIWRYVAWAFRFCKECEKYSDTPILIGVGGVIAGVIAGAAGLVLTVTGIQSGLLVWFAPKVWLLKEIAGLLK